MTLTLHAYAARESLEPPPPVLERDRLSHDPWGRGLTVEQYLERERTLWRTPFAQAGLRAFILCQGGQPLASCEAYQVPVQLGAVYDGQAQGPQASGTGVGIASVYVAAALRGRGHATTLLQMVHRLLQSEGAVCSYLMSEVDPAIYARLGYVPRRLRLRSYAPEPANPGPPLSPVDPPLRFLPLDGAGAELPTVESLLERRYRFRGPLTVRMTAAQLDWHVQRGLFYAGLLGRPLQRHAGAVCGDAFALWAQSPLQGTLRVLCLFPGARVVRVAPDFNALRDEAAAYRAVLHAARHEAHRLGLQRVELWESAFCAPFLRGGVPADSQDVPMLAPLSALGGLTPRGEDWLDWERGHWL